MTEKRLQALRNQFSDLGVDAMLLQKQENRRYITGFTGSSGYVLVSDSDAVLLTDFRYIEQATEQAPQFRIVDHGSSVTDSMRDVLQKMGVKRLGFEKDYITYGTYTTYQEKLAPVELVPTEGVVEDLRLVKDDSELAILRKAAQIADAAFEHIVGYLRPGLTERDVALELEVFMRKQGAEGSSFEIIVASGKRSSLPHGIATDKVIETGDFVKMDFGALYQGYCSDITRTVVMGKPSDRQREIYDIVLESQLRALDGLRPGMTGKEADALARDLIAARGYGDNFGHSLGHGLGLYIHEMPRLSKLSNDVLQPGHVVTVEPGIYIADFGGVRIEDDVVITETGIELLTHSTKELLILA